MLFLIALLRNSQDVLKLFPTNQFFLNNLENSSNNPKSKSSNSRTDWEFPEIILIPEYYGRPGDKEFVTAEKAIQLAWLIVAEKIVSNCSNWDENDQVNRECVRKAAEKAIVSPPKIVLYPYYDLWGQYDYDKHVKEKAIQIMDYDKADPFCQLFNLILHEILHAGGLRGGGGVGE